MEKEVIYLEMFFLGSPIVFLINKFRILIGKKKINISLISIVSNF